MRIVVFLLVTVASALMLTLTGCGGTSGVVVLPASQYFPLAQYNQWRYQVTDYTVDSAGLSARLPARHSFIGGLLVRSAQAGESDNGPGISILTVYISGIKPIAGSGWYEAVTIQQGLETGFIYYRHDANGLLARASEHEEPHYRIRQPIEVGQKWTVPTDVTGQSDDTEPVIVAHELEITSLDEVVEVSAGTFIGCLRVEENARWSDGWTYRGVNWFAADVGLVATHDYLDGVLGLEAELVDYSLR